MLTIDSALTLPRLQQELDWLRRDAEQERLIRLATASPVRSTSRLGAFFRQAASRLYGATQRGFETGATTAGVRVSQAVQRLQADSAPAKRNTEETGALVRQQMYERIAEGNGLVSAEVAALRLREGAR